MSRERKTAILEIAVRNAADGRFIPGLTITATLIDAQSKNIGTHETPFLWHPWVYHYGRSWTVPGDGHYRMQVHIDPPQFPRHDKRNSNRFTTAVEVDFDIHIKTGRKVTTDEKAA